MPKLIVLITTHTHKALEVAEAWQAAGAPGATIIESHGLHSLKEKSRSLELPLFVSMASLLDDLEESSQVLLAVVNEHLIEKLVSLATQIVGDLEQHHTGFAFVVDVEQVYGLNRR